MTRKELQLREQIACALYKSRQEDLYQTFMPPVFLRYQEKKLYRFRRPENFRVPGTAFTSM